MMKAASTSERAGVGRGSGMARNAAAYVDGVSFDNTST
jgi:hypothetical protein